MIVIIFQVSCVQVYFNVIIYVVIYVSMYRVMVEIGVFYDIIFRKDIIRYEELGFLRIVIYINLCVEQ